MQGVSLSFTGAGGLLWIFASWQLRPHDERSGASPDTDNTPLPMFAIRVDGAIMTESMLGVVEAENYRNPGLGYSVRPQATSILVSVPPGEHTIDLVTRTAVKDVYPAWIGSRELICLEMRR